MKHFLLMLISIVTIDTYAQCSFETNETDAFEGFRKLKTESKGVLTQFGGDYAHIALGQNDDLYFIDFDLTLKTSAFIISEGQEVYLMLENKEVLKAPAVDYTSSRPSMSSQLAYPRYKLSKAQVQALAESPLKKIRLHFGGSYHDLEIKNKRKAYFSMQLAQCLIDKTT